MSMFAQRKMDDLGPDVVLALRLSSPIGIRNVVTVHTNGSITYQSDYNTEVMQTQLLAQEESKSDRNNEKTVQEILSEKLPVEAFLGLNKDTSSSYYTIPSDRTCGTAANLFLRIDCDRERCLGIWNYGRGADIPIDVDAGMYKAVETFANTFNEYT